ncbi:MAG: CoA-transferase subunit beta, partial [Elusimicrobia bacterium]|nr:CoA-transferase subunit beta [Elusimicrobiota bacterium]
GGASEIAAHAQRVLIVTKLDKRAFPEKVDFVTSHGRRVAKIITNMGVLEPDASGEMVLTSLHPGVTVEQVQAAVGWTLKTAEPLKTSPAPSAREIELLRTKLDPQRRHIK